MMTNTRPRLPLAAALLLLSCAVARADYGQGGVSNGFDPSAYAQGQIMGPLTSDQQSQFDQWKAANKGTPQLPVTGGASGTVSYANSDAAELNDVGRALDEAGYGTPIDGQLASGGTIANHGGKTSYCDAGGCLPCPGNDCSTVVPLTPKTSVAGGSGSGKAGGDQGKLIALNGGGSNASLLNGGASLGGGAGGDGGATVRGQNSSTRYDAAGNSGATGNTGSSNSAGRRGDEPAQRTVSALVQDVVLPAVDPLTTASAGGTTGDGTVGTGGSASLSSIGTVAEKKSGGVPSVRYNGGSFDSLGDINNSKALGDAGSMLGDTGASNGAIAAPRKKQTNAFGTTKGAGGQ